MRNLEVRRQVEVEVEVVEVEVEMVWCWCEERESAVVVAGGSRVTLVSGTEEQQLLAE